MGRKPRKGRPAIPAGDRKSRNFTFRSRGDMHAKLTDAAALAGRSVSAEIEWRLEQSFSEDRRLEEVFGTREIYGISTILAALMYDALGAKAARAGTPLLQSPKAFEQAARTIAKTLESLRPLGEIDVAASSSEREIEAEILTGLGFADDVADDLRRQKDASYPERAKHAIKLRRHLGHLPTPEDGDGE
jgi:hypothetical protein